MISVAVIDALNAAQPAVVQAMLLKCCGCVRWTRDVTAARPFADRDGLFATADAAWRDASQAEVCEAIGHHPPIGADVDALRAKFAQTAEWSSGEQAGIEGASEATLTALRDANVAYHARFGFIFLVCATGKTAAEMLALLQARIGNDPADEWRIARGEQAKITRIRLDKLEAP
ncbi:MAG: 2-oxo-4-hydroxy-4-carboxy-5-ureidoimidazoline decarboxylase [Bradymonadia bacterium]|jgi:2-oxo-4-hydroxy-4-carboxy-5-ureidoimidazoline decarboxylase